jgi:hypothetical protein
MFKTPSPATVIIGVLAVIGTWIYILGSASVQSSFNKIVSIDFATPREVFQPEAAPRPAVRAGGSG